MRGRNGVSRGSPRRSSARKLMPVAAMLFFIAVWAVAYFTVSPFSSSSSGAAEGSKSGGQGQRLRSQMRLPEPRVVQAAPEHQEQETFALVAPPPKESADLGSIAAGVAGGLPPKLPTPENDSAKRVTGLLSQREDAETTAEGPYEMPPVDLKASKRKRAAESANGVLSSHWTQLPLNETKELYKGLKYSDLVIPRWFDLDYEKEQTHDSIEVLGGDSLGDLSAKPENKDRQAIPKKLHFTWKTNKLEELPDLFRDIQLKWKQLNPDWEIKIWTDEECEKLIKDYYPEYYFFYSDFQVTAERSDIFRYLVLDTYGGYYADMDIEPLQPMDGLVEVVKNPDCIVGLEPEVHAILAYNKYHMIGNAFMGSVPGHPLWKWLIPQTIKRYYSDRSPKEEKDATKITGPIAVDNVIQRNPEVTRSCVLLKPDVTAPAYDLNQDAYGRCQDILKKPQLNLDSQQDNPYVRICKEIDLIGDTNKDYPRESFMVHHWAHTWRAKPDAEGEEGEKKKKAESGKDKEGSDDKKKNKKEKTAEEPKIFASTNIGKEVVLLE